MSELQRPDYIAPAGEHTRTELLFRVTTRDGRISDHGPYVAGAGSIIEEVTLTLRRPPGSTLTRLARTVTTTATEWTPAEAKEENE